MRYWVYRLEIKKQNSFRKIRIFQWEGKKTEYDQKADLIQTELRKSTSNKSKTYHW